MNKKEFEKEKAKSNLNLFDVDFYMFSSEEKLDKKKLLGVLDKDILMDSLIGKFQCITDQEVLFITWHKIAYYSCNADMVEEGYKFNNFKFYLMDQIERVDLITDFSTSTTKIQENYYDQFDNKNCDYV